MTRFGSIVGVVAVALGLLIAGAAAADLSLVYASIVLAVVALLMLAVGMLTRRDELTGQAASQSGEAERQEAAYTADSAGTHAPADLASPTRNRARSTEPVTLSGQTAAVVAREQPRPARSASGAEHRPARTERRPARAEHRPARAERRPARAERGPAGVVPSIDPAGATADVEAPQSVTALLRWLEAGRGPAQGSTEAAPPAPAERAVPPPPAERVAPPPERVAPAAGRDQPLPAERVVLPPPAERAVPPPPAERVAPPPERVAPAAGRVPPLPAERVVPLPPAERAVPPPPAERAVPPPPAERVAPAAGRVQPPPAGLPAAGSAAPPDRARSERTDPAERPAPAPAASAAGESPGSAGSTPPVAADGEVSVVPGIARYHRSGCILIRFLGPDDLETMTRTQAEAAQCVPCKACRPEVAQATVS